MASTEEIVAKVGQLKKRFGLSSAEAHPKYAPSLPKGLIAGLMGGLVATAVKTIAEKFYPPRTQGQTPAPAVLADKVAGHELSPTKSMVATEAIHWTFGAMAGAAYGALVEYYPAASAKEGASFGAALEGLTHESVLPAMGLSGNPTRREHTSELATHVAYGVVTELVRGIVRRALK